jgi:hypothetical protein
MKLLDTQLSDQLALGPAEARVVLGDDKDAVPAPAGSLLGLRIDPLRLVAAQVAGSSWCAVMRRPPVLPRQVRCPRR